MNKCRNMVLYTCFVMMICCSTAWATAYDDDSQVESEAQKDMLAYVQSTFPYRFGNDLQAGDYVQYEIRNNHGQNDEPELCSLEVLERNGDVVTVKEEFEGNILFYRIDLGSKELLDYWGFNEDGIEQRPSLLTTVEADVRLKSMLGHESNPGNTEWPTMRAKLQVRTLYQRESYIIGKSSLSCISKSLDILDLNETSLETRTTIQELTKALFSDAVPKMLPVKVMADYLDNLEIFGGNTGLVKQRSYNLADYYKATR